MAKITRQHLKVFGSTGDTADFAKFGSQEAAAPIKTKDIELIQSLEAWDKGWADAIVDANKAPYMEDMNAAMYVLGYQLGYVLQEGIPEWDDGTSYYAESIVKKTATQELYASKTADNVGNALPNKIDNTDWKYLVDLDQIIPADGVVTAAKLTTDAVETAKIKNLNVTAAKLATDAVETAKIKNLNVTAAKLEANINFNGYIRKSTTSFARASRNAAQTIASGSWVKVELDAETYDLRGDFANNKFTAPVDGYYRIYMQAKMIMGIERVFNIAIFKNGFQGATAYHKSAGNNLPVTIAVTDIAFFTAGHYAETFIYHDHATSKSLEVGVGVTYMTVELVA